MTNDAHETEPRYVYLRLNSHRARNIVDKLAPNSLHLVPMLASHRGFATGGYVRVLESEAARILGHVKGVTRAQGPYNDLRAPLFQFSKKEHSE